MTSGNKNRVGKISMSISRVEVGAQALDMGTFQSHDTQFPKALPYLKPKRFSIWPTSRRQDPERRGENVFSNSTGDRSDWFSCFFLHGPVGGRRSMSYQQRPWGLTFSHEDDLVLKHISHCRLWRGVIPISPVPGELYGIIPPDPFTHLHFAHAISCPFWESERTLGMVKVNTLSVPEVINAS